MTSAYSRGWFQVAYERELSADVTPASVGETRLVLARLDDEVRAYSADCPHRGAHLGLGGRLDGDVIVCPFHGYRIGLSGGHRGDFTAREFPALVIGGLVFVRLSEGDENGMGALLGRIEDDHYFVPGFSLVVNVAADMVVENAFDSAHFHTVHSVANEPRFAPCDSEGGEYGVRGEFELPSAAVSLGGSATETVRVPFVARAYSPGVVISRLEGEYPYWLITAATPLASGGCTIRLSLAVPEGPDGSPPSAQFCERVLDEAREGILQDVPIWEHLSPRPDPHFTPRDGAVVGFRDFCARFRANGDGS